MQCSICYNNLNDNISKISCGHEFHLHCIDEWYKINITCPLCRQDPLFLERYNKYVEYKKLHPNLKKSGRRFKKNHRTRKL